MLPSYVFNLFLQIGSALGILIFNRNVATNLGASSFADWSNLRYFAEFMVVLCSLSFSQLFIIDSNCRESYFKIVKLAAFWCAIVLFLVVLLCFFYEGKDYWPGAISSGLFYSLFLFNVWKSAPINFIKKYSIIAAGPGLLLFFLSIWPTPTVKDAVIVYSVAYVVFGLYAFFVAVNRNGDFYSKNPQAPQSRNSFFRVFYYACINGSYPYANWVFLSLFESNLGNDLSGVFAVGIYVMQSVIMFPMNASAPMLMKHAGQNPAYFNRNIIKFICLIFFVAFVLSIGSFFFADFWVGFFLSSDYIKYTEFLQIISLGLPLFVFDRVMLSITQADGSRTLIVLSLLKIVCLSFAMFSGLKFNFFVGVVLYFIAYSIFFPYYFVWIKSRSRLAENICP